MRNKNLRTILLSLTLLFTMVLTTSSHGAVTIAKAALRVLLSEATEQLGSGAAKHLDKAIQPSQQTLQEVPQAVRSAQQVLQRRVKEVHV